MKFVIPARWLQGGRGLDLFRKKMKKRTDLIYMDITRDSKKVFKDTDIKGGIMCFLKDTNTNKNDYSCLLDGDKIDLQKEENEILSNCSERLIFQIQGCTKSFIQNTVREH